MSSNIVFGGAGNIQPNQPPTDIALSGTSVLDSAVAGASIATITVTDADSAAMSSIVVSNSKFAVSTVTGKTATLLRGISGTLTAGVSESVDITATDTSGNAFVKSFTITVTAANPAPTDLLISNSTILDNAASSSLVGTLTPVDSGDTSWGFAITGGTGATKFALSASSGATVNLQRSASGTLTAGVSETVTVQITDSLSQTFSKTFTITVQDHLAVNLLTTLTLANTTGSTQSAPFVTPMFGHSFKKTDIPSGQYPQFKQQDGTLCPMTMWDPVYWNDGSLKFACFMLRVPTANVSGSSSIDLNVYNNGSAPSASGRTTTEVSAAAIVVNATGMDNLSGSWASTLSDLTEVAAYADGNAGRVWRIRVPFKQSGAAHKQLECYHYIAALNDAAGALAGFRYLPRVTQPWYNADTANSAPAPSWRSMSALNFQYGAGPTTVDMIGSFYSAKTFTWAGSGNQLTCTGHSYDSSLAVRFTTTGTLPAGLSTNTTYFASVVNANTLTIYTGPAAAGAPGNGAGSIVAITDAGSGTHTITPAAYIMHFGSIFGADSNGRWRYIQGAGSVAADATIQVRFNKSYLRSTRTVPPFNTSIGTVSSNSSRTWAPYSFGPLVRFIGQTGEREDIGLISSYQNRHYHTQALVDEVMARVIGLAQAHVCTAIRDWTSKGLVHLGNPSDSYTGMPSSLATTFRFRPSIPAANGFTAPTGVPGAGGWLQGISANTLDHMTNFSYYPYLITGEPQYQDLLAEAGNLGLLSYGGSDRNMTVSATTYYGMAVSGRDTYRASAWAARNIGCAAGLLPVSLADGSQTGKYYKDLTANLFTYLQAFNNQQSTWWKTNGFFVPQNNTNGRSVWQVGYLLQALALTQCLNEDSNGLTFLQTLSNWPVHIKAAFGNLWILMGYYERSFANEPTNTTYISSDDNWGAFNQGSLSWTNATPGVFTWSGISFTPTNGDTVVFVNSPPGGLSSNTPYYAVNVSGNTFNLSATLGGAALATTNSSTLGTQTFFFTAHTAPSTGGVADSVSPAGYGANTLGAYSFLNAIGCTGLSSVLSELQTREASVTYTGDPKYAFQSSF